MKILLDTQVFIWLINEDKRLGKKAREVLYDPSNDLKLSYFSVFEMTVKASIGKLDYDPSVLDDLPKMGVELITLSPRALQGYSIFNSDNKDPFDNALITTAINESLILITSDSKILSLEIKGLNLIDSKQ